MKRTLDRTRSFDKQSDLFGDLSVHGLDSNPSDVSSFVDKPFESDYCLNVRMLSPYTGRHFD